MLVDALSEGVGGIGGSCVGAPGEGNGAVGSGWGEWCGAEVGVGRGDHGGEKGESEAVFDESDDGVGGAAIDGDVGSESGVLAGVEGVAAEVIAGGGENERLFA